MSDSECDYLVDLLNSIKGQALIQDLVNKHVSIYILLSFCCNFRTFFGFQRRELAELQVELERRVQALSERRNAVLLLDRKLVNLVEEQTLLGDSSNCDKLRELRQSLAARTEQELREIEQRKQG